MMQGICLTELHVIMVINNMMQGASTHHALHAPPYMMNNVPYRCEAFLQC